jgi:ATP-binding cassette, subfamily B, bacterial MsbA
MPESVRTYSGTAVYRRLLGYLRPYRAVFLLGMFGMVLYSYAEMRMAAIMQVVIDEVFITQQREVIVQVLLTMLFIIVGRSGGTFIADYFMARAGRGIIKDLRRAMFKCLLRMPNSAFDKTSSGELLAMFSYNVEQVAEATTTVVTTVVRDSILVVMLVGFMFYLNYMLATVFFVVGPLSALIVYAVSSRFRKLSRRIQQSVGMVTHIANETIEGHQVVKIFGGERKELASFGAANEHNYLQNMKLTLSRIISESLIQTIATTALIAIIYLATSGLIGEVTAGMFSAYMIAMTRLFPPLKHLTNINAQLQKGIAAAQSIFNMLDIESERDTGTLEIGRTEGRIEYRNVNFSYDPAKGRVLDSISFAVEPGETVALVGRSGSGKSTLVKLLPRFYEVTEGQILLDDRDINEYRLQSLRDQIALVSQHVTLFNDTVANNIAYGRLAKVSREDIREAAKAAYALDFIERLPEGFDTLVGEDGILLSGGQRQRLAIARAILKDAPILILDEATSALDSESEKQIQRALERLMKTRTTIVIAHRLSTIEKANRILVLDHGRIVEQGAHRQLLAKKGHYASLHALQFETDGPAREPVADEPVAEIAYPVAQHNFLAEKPGASVWETLWYGYHPAAQLLAPFGYLFGMIVGARRFFYRSGLLRVRSFPVPVIVIGNITVGGTGKTPLVIWLAEHLKKLGYRPGIVSRGYKGKSSIWPLPVTPDSDPVLVGDEAAMIVSRTGCPMMIGPNRCKAAEQLLLRSDCNVIISDDGLQHYAMGRDIEIVVADGARGFGNGMLLPAGPMRESKQRLKRADYIVTNGSALPESHGMYVRGDTLWSLHDGARKRRLKDLKGQRVHALAAIGNPQRFFELLRNAGLEVIEHAFPDHHRFSPADLDFPRSAAPVVMTEKDAVKCRRHSHLLEQGRYWYLPVTAQLSPVFVEALTRHIEKVANEKKAA